MKYRLLDEFKDVGEGAIYELEHEGSDYYNVKGLGKEYRIHKKYVEWNLDRFERVEEPIEEKRQKYRLLKDTVSYMAIIHKGVEFEFNGENLYINKNGWYFCKDIVENNPEWFEKIEEATKEKPIYSIGEEVEYLYDKYANVAEGLWFKGVVLDLLDYRVLKISRTILAKKDFIYVPIEDIRKIQHNKEVIIDGIEYIPKPLKQ